MPVGEEPPDGEGEGEGEVKQAADAGSSLASVSDEDLLAECIKRAKAGSACFASLLLADGE